MSDDAIDQKTKVQILLAEHASLRSETNARISSAYIAAGWTTAAIIWLLQQEMKAPRFWIGLGIWVIGTAFSARIMVFDARNAAQRVREVERKINTLAHEQLLVWESERGGLNRDYWLRLFFLKR